MLSAALVAACGSGGHHGTASPSPRPSPRRTTTTTRPTGAGGQAASSSTSTTSGTAAPATTAAPGGGTATKAAFLVQANAICRSTNAETNAIGDSLGANPSGADQAAALDKGADLVAAGILQMQHLEQPSGDRSDLVRFYQRTQQLVVLTRELADAFRADDMKKATDVETRANALDDDLTKAADAYGLTACGSGSQG